jgi:CubicO group peptidase (beta-lactamase class C family)
MPLAPVVRLARRTPCLLTVALLGACSNPDAVPRDAWRANVEMFDAELQDLQTALGIPGLAYVIVSDSGPVASRAFGTTQPPDSAPFTTSTPRRIASITKSLTAIVALQLVEEGRLDLDAPAR